MRNTAIEIVRNCLLSPYLTFRRGTINFTGHLHPAISLNVTETRGKVLWETELSLEWKSRTEFARLIFFLSSLLNGNGENYDFDLWATLHFRALEISVLWSRGLSSATGNGLRSAATVVVMLSNNDTKKKKI